MSTPAEDKLVTFLRRLQDSADLGGLSFIKKIYSDSPRKDLSRNRSANFPRVQVTEQGGTSKFSGIGATDRIHELTLSIIVYVDNDDPISEADVSTFWTEGRNLSPEEACGAICYEISRLLGVYKATLGSDNSYKFILRGGSSFDSMGLDDQYFRDFDVNKGKIDLNFFLRY